MVIEELSFETPKTKEMVKLLEALNIIDKKVLVVVEEFDENVILASRNLGNIALVEYSEINVLDLINADYVLATSKAINKIEEVLA